MKILRLDRRKKKVKRIIFVFLGILIFFGSCLLSLCVVSKFLILLTKVFVSIFGSVGSILIFSVCSIGGFVKLYFREVNLYKDNNDIILNDRISKNADVMRKKLYVIKGTEVENNLSCELKNDRYNVDKPYLKIVNSASDEVRVKKRVRIKGK